MEHLSEFAAYLARPFDIAPGSRLFIVNWAAFAVCGAAVFWLAARRGDRPAGSLLGFLFPRRMYLHASTLTDLKIYVANFFVRLTPPGLRTALTAGVATVVASLAAPLAGEPSGGAITGAALVCVTLLVALANDLTTYVTHRIGHEAAAFWPFHAVHHSAEVLTPLTVFRKHPVYNACNTLIHPFVAGPVIGVVMAAFGTLDFLTILGINAVYAAFNFAGANLRHSHIWITFPRWLSYIFVSPAMHQIHHSIDPKHFNKNYGEIFALWDWMGGSLYIPREREDLAFGLLDGSGAVPDQPHPSLRAAYVGPFLECAEVLRGGPAEGGAPSDPRPAQ